VQAQISSYFTIHLFLFGILIVDVGAPPTGRLAPLTPTAPPAASENSTDAGTGLAAAALIEIPAVPSDQQQPLPNATGGQNNTSRVFEIKSTK